MKQKTNKIDGRIWLIAGFLVLITLAFSFDTQAAADEQTFHTAAEYSFFTTLTDSLPRGYNGLFAGSGECVQCHGYDTAMIASVDLFGNDINLVDDWRATLMANSAKDPFWRAKVSHEVLLSPSKQVEIETKCTSCHAPMGHFAAFHQGADSYTMAEMLADTFALDGVSCLVCHQQSADDLGNLHSGNLNFDTAKVAYGPFTSPLSSPMLNATQYEPLFAEHISDAGLCAGCHTLITETLDLDGNLTGNTFVEQATYHEWLNSEYETMDVSCQSCHMPELSKGQFYLISGLEVPPRDRFYLHELAGANVNMLKLMKDNIAQLGISATPQDFDEVISATEKMLRFNTINTNVTALERTADTAFLAVRLTNKAGHKFPSGYPARRAFVKVLVETAEGDTLFHSGAWDDNYEVVGHDLTYEQHYPTVRAEDQVQIYEQVLADVTGAVTTVLTHADYSHKDNRLPPKGFRKDHAVYDTTLIVGQALLDTDFNEDETGEGTGSDIIYYHIPTAGYLDELNVTVGVYYQSMPPKWMAPMLAEQTPEIDAFRDMFNAADRNPFLLQEKSIAVGGIVSTRQAIPELDAEVQLLAERQLLINSPAGTQLYVYNYLGQLLQQAELKNGENSINLNHPTSGLVIVHLRKGEQILSRTFWVNQ